MSIPGFLGSCWAFSTAENLEGQLFLSKGILEPLSVEQLIECDASADATHDHADCGEFGGWPYLAYDFLTRSGGIFSEKDFPYCSGIPYGEAGNCLPCMPSDYSKALCGNHKDLVRTSKYAFLPASWHGVPLYTQHTRPILMCVCVCVCSTAMQQQPEGRSKADCATPQEGSQQLSQIGAQFLRMSRQSHSTWLKSGR